MTSPLSGLGVSLPVLAAPMAGGPTTVAMVLAASEAGSLGFLAGGLSRNHDYRYCPVSLPVLSFAGGYLEQTRLSENGKSG